jgi:hypothetical protein
VKARRLVMQQLAGLALAPLLALPVRAVAGKLAKADVQYQDKPEDGKDCDDCIQFIADRAHKGAGTCKVVAGPVSAHGYCLAFTPKPSKN